MVTNNETLTKIAQYTNLMFCSLSLFLSLWSVRLPFAGSLDLVRAHESHTAVADAGHRQSCRVSIG